MAQHWYGDHYCRRCRCIWAILILRAFQRAQRVLATGPDSPGLLSVSSHMCRQNAGLFSSPLFTRHFAICAGYPRQPFSRRARADNSDVTTGRKFACHLLSSAPPQGQTPTGRFRWHQHLMLSSRYSAGNKKISASTPVLKVSDHTGQSAANYSQPD